MKKLFLMLVFSLLLGFTIWYLIFSFLASDFNPFDWNIWFKIFYLILSVTTGNAILKRGYTEDIK